MQETQSNTGSIHVWGRSLGGGNGNPLQYPCLKTSTDRGPWWAAVHGVTESDTTEHTRTRAHTHAHTHTHTHTHIHCSFTHNSQYMETT